MHFIGRLPRCKKVIKSRFGNTELHGKYKMNIISNVKNNFNED